MTSRPQRPRSDPALAPFPQPVGTFAGRSAELARIVAHVDRDTLFLIYGVGGIGKSELAYRVIREVRARARWADATPILVEARPGTTAARTLAQLLAAVGARRAHGREQLAALARALEARPYLLFLDDVHNLPPDVVAEARGSLARRVQRSRLFVASRREVRMPDGAPLPVVTALGPLDAAAAEEMMGALADRMQVPRLAPEQLMRATHGSPFFIHRLLARHAPETGSLEETLDAISTEARRLLLAVAVAQHRPSLDALRRTPLAAGDALRDLEERFLLGVARGELSVHDLVREALLTRTDAGALSTAHEDAAALCLAALVESERPPLLLAVDAVSHLVAAERFEDAWRVIERWHSPLAAAGSEHLLREPLERVREAVPERRVAADLLIARGLVRASLIEEAGRVLARIGDRQSDAEEARHALLAGEIAQRAGAFARAEQLFARAASCAADPDTGFQARVQLATAAVFEGDGPRARRTLEAALAELPSPSSRQRARAAWALTVSWMFDERYERAAEEARRARLALEGTGQGDLANQLAMLETLARIEHEDMEGARAAAGRIDEAGLRRRVAALYRAVMRYADGEAADASAALLETHESMRAAGDTINAYLAGYYGSAALAESGKLAEAQAMAERTAGLADAAGLRGAAARSRAQQALFAAEAGQTIAAHRLADEALASAHVGPRSRAKACCAHAHAYTIEGDVGRALEQVARARAAVADPDLAVAHAAIDVEHAAIVLVGGDPDDAVARAERAVERYGDRSRDYERARARLVLAAAYVVRGRRTDLLFAERTLAEARALAERGSLRAVQVGCAIVAAALARRTDRARAAHDLLASALRDLDPERGSVYAGILMAAIDGGVAARAVPGAVALLAHLGFAESVDGYLVDRHGRRAATEQDIARERELRDLFVDESRAAVFARRGAFELRGRPMLCGLLSQLVQARGAAVSAEALYERVWGAPEYHPLKHRNTLYVAINRLRACLRRALPGRDAIERVGGGWRLADGVDASAALAVRERAPASLARDR